MKLGLIGLGKMGYPMVKRMLKNGKEIVVYNRSPEKVDSLAKDGAVPSHSYEEFVGKLDSPRIIWLMVPHQTVDEVIGQILPLLSEGDILIDGGNSNFKESVRRADEAKEKGVRFMDIGVSGGTLAAERGYCMMIGGEEDAYKVVEPFIEAMCKKEGFGLVGPNGSGHYVKMVHNAIEYGMMEAIGEGYDLIVNSRYKDVDLLKLSNIWQNGSIIESFLLEMVTNGLKKHGDMSEIDGVIADSGEGRWAVQEAIDNKVSFTANTYALMERFRSRQCSTFSDKLLSVMRDEFGGHGFKK